MLQVCCHPGWRYWQHLNAVWSWVPLNRNIWNSPKVNVVWTEICGFSVKPRNTLVDMNEELFASCLNELYERKRKPESEHWSPPETGSLCRHLRAVQHTFSGRSPRGQRAIKGGGGLTFFTSFSISIFTSVRGELIRPRSGEHEDVTQAPAKRKNRNKTGPGSSTTTRTDSPVSLGGPAQFRCQIKENK